jgi:hypothetical protein
MGVPDARRLLTEDCSVIRAFLELTRPDGGERSSDRLLPGVVSSCSPAMLALGRVGVVHKKEARLGRLPGRRGAKSW